MLVFSNFSGRHRYVFLGLVLALTMTGAVLSARCAEASLLGRTSESLVADANDGKLDDFNLLEAALVAAGVESPQELSKYSERFDNLKKHIAAQLAKIPHKRNPHRRAEFIYEQLHRRLLVGKYRAELAGLDETLAIGDYNCLTATISYCCLCRHFDLPVKPYAVPGHVWCRLQSDQPLDVETTCRQWFSLDRQSRKRTAAAVQRPGNIPRRITPIQLLGKVYYNRALELLKQGRYDGAVELLSISTRWDAGDRDARENLLAAMNNWALALCDQRRYVDALRRLDAGRSIDPEYSLFDANARYVRHCWARELRQRGQAAVAEKVLAGGDLSQTPEKSSHPDLTNPEL